MKDGANAAGAQGPMQMLPATFAVYNHPGDADPLPTGAGGAHPPSPYNPTDTIYSATRYLCASGIASDVNAAVITYNCGNPGPACQVASAGYAADVMATAAGVRGRTRRPSGDEQAGNAVRLGWREPCRLRLLRPRAVDVCTRGYRAAADCATAVQRGAVAQARHPDATG